MRKTYTPFDEFFEKRKDMVAASFGTVALDALYSLMFESFQEGAKIGADSVRKGRDTEDD